jgi:hypothetical protein
MPEVVSHVCLLSKVLLAGFFRSFSPGPELELLVKTACLSS